ncbi:MAG: T9SS type A sorting domain-containing protein [Ignavibacteria bacterium]
MKKCYCALALLLNSVMILSQWLPDARLTNATGDSYTSYNNAKNIASSGADLYAVWTDTRDGNGEIYFKHSSNSGISWGTDTRITNNNSYSGYPSVAVSGIVLHVAWYDSRDGNEEIYYKRSTDGGLSWGADTRMTTEDSSSAFPSLVVSGSTVHLLWRDSRNPVNEIYYRRSTDGGVTWLAETRLSNDPANSYSASISTAGSYVYAVWEDNRDAGGVEIYFKRSSDVGATWGADTRLTVSNGNSEYPCVESSGNDVYVSWNDNRDGNIEIYFKHSTDGGNTWGPDMRLTTSAGDSFRPSLAVSGSSLHLVWFDSRDVNYEIYSKNSSNSGVDWGQDQRLTNNSLISAQPFVTASGTFVHVLWTDNRDGNYEIYYKGDPTGNTIGIQQISTFTPEKYSLEQNYPNPFNPATNIQFSIPESGNIILKVFDVSGREAAELVNGRLSAGSYNHNFDASQLASGIYFYKLESESFSQTKRMVLIK